MLYFLHCLPDLSIKTLKDLLDLEIKLNAVQKVSREGNIN